MSSSESHLLGEESVDGLSWVHDEGAIRDKARLRNGATVHNGAEVSGSALVDCAHIYHKARVYGNAVVSAGAVVCDGAVVCGKATVAGPVAVVCGSAHVCGESRVENCLVRGRVMVSGSAVLLGTTRTFSHSLVLSGGMRVGGTAKILGGHWEGDFEINEGVWNSPEDWSTNVLL